HDAPAAIAMLEDALPKARRTGLENVVVRLESRLALAHAVAGDRTRSAQHERSTPELLAGEIEPDARVGRLIDSADAPLTGTDCDRVAAWLEEIEPVAGENSWKYAQARTLRLRAALERRRGHWDRAEAHLDAALALARTGGFRSVAAKCYKDLGNIHWDIGLRAQAE